MEYKPKEVLLKNGTPCLLKSPGPGDASAILKLMSQTSEETSYMARYADEVNITLHHEQDFLSSTLKSQKDLMICAVVNGKIIANAGINPIAVFERYLHRATFGISICKAYWGLGIGSHLLAAIIRGAREMGYEQLELEVVQENQRGIALYEKFGFETYGTREYCFKYRDGSYAAAQLMMVRL
ncbi:MAG TPA: GNAT family N-acetyltransferase [Lachnoclostridium sp.]|jgi:ribosomal protein S18 acetylase RimI-like enzyme|uniref:GNAT family N-acetyltransferase n=2 Tax=Lacrimispora sp. TaxID=2719234 RepID=UPI000EE721BF|nr:GNAT family N-acetyltransferase [Lacrimispora sp.]HCD46603.1 GNAT family N-acetyltransferase [Lachnoclostridium sp.]